jgi:hypothetical protein
MIVFLKMLLQAAELQHATSFCYQARAEENATKIFFGMDLKFLYACTQQLTSRIFLFNLLPIASHHCRYS